VNAVERTASIIAMMVAWLLLLTPLHVSISEVNKQNSQDFESGYDIEDSTMVKQYIENQFYENQGQVEDSHLKFYGKAPGGSIGFAFGKVFYRVNGELMVLSFKGANEITPTGSDMVQTNINFFLGDRGTFPNVRGFHTVIYEDIWSGITLVYSSTSEGLKHEFRMTEDADPNEIRLRWTGSDMLLSQMSLSGGRSSEKAQLSIGVGLSQDEEMMFMDSVLNDAELLTSSPSSIQLEEETELPISFSTFLGGTSEEGDESVAVDQNGCTYVSGYTASSDFPIWDGINSSHNGDHDCFVVKLNSTGDGIVYSTFIGGGATDSATSIDIDSGGNVYVGGYTISSDFPIKNALDSIAPDFSYKCFLLKLNATGNGLVYSTFVGGSNGDSVTDIAVSHFGELYATGSTISSDFPLVNAFDTVRSRGEGFVIKLNETGNGLNFSTFLGGFDGDYPSSLELDSSGNVFVTGGTSSSDFPVANAIDDTYNGDYEAFVTKLTSSGGLVYSTFIGGDSRDQGESIDVDSEGSVYVSGVTQSPDFPLSNPIDSVLNASEGFVLKIDPLGTSILFSTFIGGSGADSINGIVTDSMGNMYLTGQTNSTDFPVVGVPGCIFSGGALDGVLLKLNSPGDLILFSTYIGGANEDNSRNIAIDSAGDAFIVGHTTSSDFPMINSFDNIYNGSGDCFMLKMRTADGDGDGMPDWWEEQFGLDPVLIDSHLDFDSDELSNLDEYLIGTQVNNSDTDSDTMLDGWEVAHNLDPFVYDAGLDPDVDELVNLEEFLHNTDPHDNDSDFDLMPDGWEVWNNLDPLYDDASQDPDEDSLSNLEEFEIGTLPRNSDTDADTMPDGWELHFGLDPLLNDAGDDLDLDDLSNADEYLSSTYPDDPDSEDDGMLDGWEVSNGLMPTLDDSGMDPDEDDLANLGEYNWRTDPYNNDTDSDSMLDGWEVRHGFNPLVNDAGDDADLDGLSNAEEHLHGSDPRSSDGDGDGFSDLWEVRNGFDPSDPVVPLLQHIVFNAALIVALIGISSLLIVVFGVMPYQEKQRQITAEIEREKRIDAAFTELTDSKQNTEEG
jgi:hypothetical protein